MRPIDAYAVNMQLVELYNQENNFTVKNALRNAMQVIADAPTIAPPPNDPLTLEELRKMDGEPMWISGEGIDRYDIFCGISSDNVVQFYKAALPIYSYGSIWMAYRNMPLSSFCAMMKRFEEAHI